MVELGLDFGFFILFYESIVFSIGVLFVFLGGVGVFCIGGNFFSKFGIENCLEFLLEMF